jgi:subtilase family serine protease
VISDVRIEPSTIYEEGEVTIKAVVHNRGNLSDEDFFVDFYLNEELISRKEILVIDAGSYLEIV